MIDTHDYGEEVLNSMAKEELEDVLSTLTPKENNIVRLRFGFYDGQPKTLEEIGQMYNVNRERIRQILAKALRKLRYSSRIKRIKNFCDSETEKYGNGRSKI